MLPKGYDYKFSDYLHSDEIHCKCSSKTCHYTLINPTVIDAFLKTRIEAGVVFRINSFYRCQNHNDAVGGVDESSHTTGNALDISTRGFTGKEIEEIVKIAKKYFDYVQVYPTFIHLQINVEEPEEVGGICG